MFYIKTSLQILFEIFPEQLSINGNITCQVYCAETNFYLRHIIVIAPTILRSQLKQLFAQKSPQRRKFDRVYLGRIVYQGCCSKTRLPTVPNILAQACLYVP